MLSDLFLKDREIFDFKYNDNILVDYPELSGVILYKKYKKVDLIEQKFSSRFDNFITTREDVILGYENIQKGEFGVVCNSNSILSFYECKIENDKIIIVKELDLKISEKIIDKDKRILRNPF